MATLLRFQGSSARPTTQHQQQQQEGGLRTPGIARIRIFIGFWLLGLINNAAYVIMIAGANEITASAVGLVYFCAIFPTILVKLSAPYWFHLVGYTRRFWAAAGLMASSFCIVGLSSSTARQLMGVGLVALQGGLGEASALGLAARYPSQMSLTAWSSGTGFAGIFGYAWVALLHVWLRLSYTATLLLAVVLPGLWLVVFHLVLRGARPSSSLAAVSYTQLPIESAASVVQADSYQLLHSRGSSRQTSRATSPGVELSTSSPEAEQQQEPPGPAAANGLSRHHDHSQQHQQQQHQQQRQQLLPPGTVLSSSNTNISSTSGALAPAAAANGAASGAAAAAANGSSSEGGEQLPVNAASMSTRQRLAATARLWPFMVPLFVVYFAEYAMQSGTWTAIGFPVASAQARHAFYLYANWTYQAGVFVSRSSGMLFQANRLVLWLMPGLQCLLLLFFGVDAVTHWWYDWSLLLPCFVTGLLGGAVYVNAFTLLSKEVEPVLREFSLSAACVADSLGIAAADLTAILIQGCLFRWQGLPGAAYAC